MEPILSLSPQQFLAALDELQLDPARRDDLVRQYRRANSPFSSIYGLLDRVAAEDAGQGMQRAAMLPVARPEGMSVAEAVRSGEAQFAVPQGLFDAVSALAGGVDAPAAAALGLIPEQDMAAEALGTAGVAMGAGGLLARPAGSVGMGGRVAGDDYRGAHRAPGRTDDGSTASIDNLTGIYPDDIYDVRVAPRYYGDMTDPASDRQMIELFARLRGRPDVGVPVYRAVPIDAPDELNPGDWVTPSRRYAEAHGESALGGEYRIIEGNVPARELYTDANSIFEFGWSPELSANRSTAVGLLASAAETPAQRVAGLLREGRASEVTDDLMAQADPQEMYRLYESGATGADMPMDFESRMRRAIESGFNVNDEMYRGDAPRSVFQTGQGQRDQIGVTMSSRPDVAASYIPARGEGGIYPLFSRGQNDAIVQAQGRNWNVIDRDARVSFQGDDATLRDYIPDSYFEPYDVMAETDFLNTNDLSRMFQGYGADRVRFNDLVDRGASARYYGPESSMPSDVMMVANPANVRSRFARFDPRLSHLANLNAANVDPITGAAAVTASQQDDPLANLRAYISASGGILPR